MKTTTIDRFRAWAEGKSDSDVFTTGGTTYTREQFEVEFMGRKPQKTTKPINTDVEVKNADLDTTQPAGNSPKFGE